MTAASTADTMTSEFVAGRDLDALEAGEDEVLVGPFAEQMKAGVSGPVSGLTILID